MLGSGDTAEKKTKSVLIEPSIVGREAIKSKGINLESVYEK